MYWNLLTLNCFSLIPLHKVWKRKCHEFKYKQNVSEHFDINRLPYLFILNPKYTFAYIFINKRVRHTQSTYKVTQNWTCYRATLWEENTTKHADLWYFILMLVLWSICAFSFTRDGCFYFQDGRVECVTENCNTQCRNPTPGPGNCCPSCNCTVFVHMWR